MPPHRTSTRHIRRMLETAHQMAALAEEYADEPFSKVPAELVSKESDNEDSLIEHEALLRRAATLCEHAAAELRDEADLLEGWRMVP